MPQAKVLSMDFIAKNPTVRDFLSHPAGPFTIHFWAPTMKWAITFANIADLKRDPRTMSLNQQLAVTGTGIIWSRYSFVITPVNYNLFAVNIVMAMIGGYQLSRILTYKPPVEAPLHTIPTKHAAPSVTTVDGVPVSEVVDAINSSESVLLKEAKH
jgi:hypothetical protein